MDQRDDYRELDARPPRFLRFLVRRALPAGLVVLLVAAILILRFGYHESDRYYAVHASGQRAEVLAKACWAYHRVSPDGRYPADLADLRSPPGGAHVIDDGARDLTDAWGNPFRYVTVPSGLAEMEVYVWAERTQSDGRVTLVGAKVAADGSVTRFGLPPKD